LYILTDSNVKFSLLLKQQVWEIILGTINLDTKHTFQASISTWQRQPTKHYILNLHSRKHRY